MLNSITRINKKLFQKVTSLLSILSMLALISSCQNDHCNDSMYAPTTISFYSEIDTSVQATPLFVALQGIGSDSIINATGSANVSLLLNNSDNSCQYAFSIGHSLSQSDTLNVVGSDTYKKKNGEIITLTKTSGNFLFFGSFNEQLYLKSIQNDTTIICYVPDIDTLNLNYQNQLDFVSAECGCLTTHTLNRVYFKNDGIGTVTITNPIITNKYDEKHVKIYLENY